MGFKKTNYEVKTLGITLPEAYAQITGITADSSGRCSVEFTIQKSREGISTMRPVATEYVSCIADKSEPLFAQAYAAAKEGIFFGWEDDIID